MTVSTFIARAAVAFMTALCCSLGTADVLRQRDGTVLFGRIQQQSDQEIVFRERVNAENYIERRIASVDVVSLIRTIDDARLAGLSPSRPIDYLNLAEELATLRRDPEAHDLSIRLYLIATRLGQPAERGRAVRALISLGRTPQERRRFAELAYLLDDMTTPAILDPGDGSKGVESSSDAGDVIAALQRLRQGDGSSLGEVVEHESTEALLSRFASICTNGQLRKFAAAPPSSLEDRQQLIQLEFALLCVASSRPEANRFSHWNWNMQDESLDRWEPPTPSNVSEFDPTRDVFRDGKWQSE